MKALDQAGAVVRLLGSRLGTVSGAGGEQFEVDATLENSPSVLFDALVLPDGSKAIAALGKDGHTLEFLKDQYRHCKTILAIGASSMLLEKAGISDELPAGGKDSGLLRISAAEEVDPRAFLAALGKHRHPLRDRDPPLI
jgi:catalase